MSGQADWKISNRSQGFIVCRSVRRFSFFVREKPKKFSPICGGRVSRSATSFPHCHNSILTPLLVLILTAITIMISTMLLVVVVLGYIKTVLST
jgi:hypothetical protein